ncbi:MAG TPA: undecaprenyl diphosphate synthase family protein, partial [Candidatus Paceibacterota bacterium]|nr:undecaprenyl diphosphate synthase family protein [Candidatus Paceibacterota bacterium]
MATIKHLAIIPDGNRRWAKAKGLAPWQGHIKASKNIPEIIKEAFTIGINSVTIWGGSYDNLTKRTPEEIGVLDRVYSLLTARFLKSKDVKDGKVRLKVLGEWKKLLRAKTKQDLIRAENTTKKNG